MIDPIANWNEEGSIPILEMASGGELKRLGAGEIDIGLLRPPIPRTGVQFLGGEGRTEDRGRAGPAGHRLKPISGRRGRARQS
jgi:hypothetical protein